MSECNLSRRRIVAGIAGGSALALAAPTLLANGVGAQAGSINQIMKNAPPLYHTVGNIAGEWMVVRYFFSFTCNFSKEYHDAIYQWGMSLPNSVSFRPTIVFGANDDGGIPAAITFYALWRNQPHLIKQFMVMAYNNIGQGVLDPTDIKTYLRIAGEVGADLDMLGKTMRSKVIMDDAMAGGVAANRYNVKTTPSLGVGGRYLTTPDSVGGKSDLLIQLLNALTSKMIIGANS